MKSGSDCGSEHCTSSGLGWKRLKLVITWSNNSIALSSPQYFDNCPPIEVW